MNKLLNKISDVELVDGLFLKRNDLIQIYNSNGLKAQGALNFILNAKKQGKSVVSVGSRYSPQCDIISDICNNENVNCDLFLPSGEETDVIKRIINRGCNIHRIKYGYTSNLIYNAKKFSYDKKNRVFIPFGMMCLENIHLIAKQVENIPYEVKRIIVPIGSGVNFCGIMQGLMDFNRFDVELVGVQVGAISTKFIKNHLPIMNEIKYKIITYKEEFSSIKRYNQRVFEKIGNVELNPIYEGKCFSFLRKGDCFWIVGR